MTDNLRPIETFYGGYRFRSRLEARWAVFLDACGLRFDYEPEGFDLGGVRYLPDFWVHPQPNPKTLSLEAVRGFWLEVKGPAVKDGDESWLKAQALAVASSASVVVFAGQIRPGQNGLLFTEDGATPRAVRWVQCPWCSCIQPVTDIWEMDCACWLAAPGHGKPLEAIRKAMQARFEFGERGR